MNDERIKLKGMLAEARHKLKEKDLEAKGLVILIRNLLNPYETDLCSLKIDEALASTKRLQHLIDDMRELKAKVKELSEALDG